MRDAAAIPSDADPGPDPGISTPGGCCSAGLAASATVEQMAASAAGERMAGQGAERWAHAAKGDAASVDLMVPGIHCPGCMRVIETGLGKHLSLIHI